MEADQWIGAAPERRTAGQIMDGFAHRTGLAPEGPQSRYLWTDAFALCNYLSLYRRSGKERFRDLAVRLIDRVHHVLGRHRPDDPRDGWISGLEAEEGERHPTAGGLRIGKKLNERGPGEPYDPRLEWDRDGQYYHYLLRWMHALTRAAHVLQDSEYLRWAVELARAAHRGFTYAPLPGAPKRMYWKVSVDLSRPLVPSQGAHDPVDGLVTLSAVRAGRWTGVIEPHVLPNLGREIRELRRMSRAHEWATADPLGAGGLLADTWWVAQLIRSQTPAKDSVEPILPSLVDASIASLEAVSRSNLFRLPLEQRLGFRELGLAIGLRAAQALLDSLEELPAPSRFETIRELERFAQLASAITSTWLAAEARATPAWKAHEDINEVMLATALVPDEHIRV